MLHKGERENRLNGIKHQLHGHIVLTKRLKSRSNCIHDADDLIERAPNNTAYRRLSCHSGLASRCANGVDLSCPSNMARVTVFCKPAMRTHWMAGTAQVSAGNNIQIPGLSSDPTFPTSFGVILFFGELLLKCVHYLRL